MCLKGRLMLQKLMVVSGSPGPRHGPLLRIALWEVIPSEAEHLQPVGARVTPPVGFGTGNVEVTGSLGVVTQSSLLHM